MKQVDRNEEPIIWEKPTGTKIKEKLSWLLKNKTTSRIFFTIVSFFAVDLAENTLRITDKIPEGNVIQRAIDTTYLLVRDFYSGGHDLLGSWLKFNGAEVYAKEQGLKLTSISLRHFLYGGGESLDVTEAFTQSLRNQVVNDNRHSGDLNTFNDFTNEEIVKMSDSELISIYIQGAFESQGTNWEGEDEYHSYSFARSATAGSTEYFEIDNIPEMIGKKVMFFQIVNGFNKDLLNSLGRFTLVVEGNIVEVNPDTNAVTLSDIEWRIVDTYDWANRSDLEVGGNLSSLLQGKSVYENMPEDIKNWINDLEVEITDDEGRNLQDSGISHSFNIYGGGFINKELAISFAHIQQPSEDMLGK